MIPSRCAYCISVIDPDRRLKILKIRRNAIRYALDEYFEKLLIIEGEIAKIERELNDS